MSSRNLVPLVAVALLVFPGWLVADEEPGKPLPGPAANKKEEAAEVLSPAKAYRDMQKRLSEIGYPKRRPAQAAAVKAFFDVWDAQNRTVAGEDLQHLGLFYRMAARYPEAHAAFSGVMSSEATDLPWRDQAAGSIAGLLTISTYRATLAFAARSVELDNLLAWAESIPTDEPARAGARTSLMYSCARLLDMEQRQDESLALTMRLVMEDPAYVGRSYRGLVRGLLGSSHALSGYDAVRRAFSGLQPVLMHQQTKAIEIADAALAEAKVALEAAGEKPFVRTAETPRPSRAQSAYTLAVRRASGAKSILRRLETAQKPFDMLGRVAPAWSLVKAYGDVEQITDLRGKVVVIDFWATWCGWCIKSFPAIRDLLRDYGDEDLTVVGVTASSRSVFEHRYDLDDDLAAKAKAATTKGRYRPKPGPRLASAGRPADGKVYFEAVAFAQKEQEALATFIANHEMTWPVVMIDKTEPSAKYALTGWPHAVVLDRQGRVRYFKSGALLRDRPEAVAAFRKVLDDLLEE